jgi:type I restriction enzyme R subunit
VYESTGTITRFTDGRDPKPRSREVFNFHRPETMQEWLSKPDSLRARFQAMPPLPPADAKRILRGGPFRALPR